jgi:hypothetical protein
VGECILNAEALRQGKVEVITANGREFPKAVRSGRAGLLKAEADSRRARIEMLQPVAGQVLRVNLVTKGAGPGCEPADHSWKNLRR